MSWQGPPGQPQPGPGPRPQPQPQPRPQPQPYRPAPVRPGAGSQGYPQRGYQQGPPQPQRQPQGYPQGQPQPGQNRPPQTQPHQQPNPSWPTQQFGSGLVRPDAGYGIAKPLPQSYGVRPEPPGAGRLLAAGLFLLFLSFIVPASLLYLSFGTIPQCLPGAALGTTCSVENGATWGLVVPIITAILAIGFAGRVIANAGSRRRPLRAAVHLLLGVAVLAIAIDQVTTNLGISYFTW